jgi:hypothetical protein
MTLPPRSPFVAQLLAVGPTGILPVVCQIPHPQIPIERQPRIIVEPTRGVTPANCIANPLM